MWSPRSDRRARARAGFVHALERALDGRRHGHALSVLLDLAALEPDEPRWHQKYGELLRTLGRSAEAAAAYRRAARCFETLDLPVRASAALRVADQLDGAHSAAHMPIFSSDRYRPAVCAP